MTAPDSIRWEAFYQPWDGYGKILCGNNKKYYFEFDVDSACTMNISFYQDSNDYHLKYKQLDSIRHHVHGKFKQDSLDIILQKENVKERELAKRGGIGSVSIRITVNF